MQDHLIVGEIDFAASTVVGYLQKPQIYYPRGSRYGSFVRWDKARTHNVSDQLVIEEARKLSREHSQPVLIILNRAINAKLIEQHNLSFLVKFTGSVIGNEGFHLYLMPNG